MTTTLSPAETLAKQLADKVSPRDPDHPAEHDRHLSRYTDVIQDLLAHKFTVTPPLDLGIEGEPEAILTAAGIDPVITPILAIKALRDTPGWKLGLRDSKDVVDQLVARRVAEWIASHDDFAEDPDLTRRLAAAHFGISMGGQAMTQAFALIKAHALVGGQR